MVAPVPILLSNHIQSPASRFRPVLDHQSARNRGTHIKSTVIPRGQDPARARTQGPLVSQPRHTRRTPLHSPRTHQRRDPLANPTSPKNACAPQSSSSSSSLPCTRTRTRTPEHERRISFLDLPDDLLFAICVQLEGTSLCAIDATSRRFRSTNRALGLWKLLGLRHFRGLEVERRGLFTDFEVDVDDEKDCFCTKDKQEDNYAVESPTPARISDIGASSPPGFRPPPRSTSTIANRAAAKRRDGTMHSWKINSWKRRFAQFKNEVYEFRGPFDVPCVSIHNVVTPDEVAYTKCRFRGDIFHNNPDSSIYLEVSIAANADNLSIALVDFDEGGKSSVTFSPDTGAVIKETKVQESPRIVKGSYVQPLAATFTKFKGKCGIYIKHGLISFYRQYTKQEWECTGFVVDFSWAQSDLFTPCLAFRDEGKYSARISSVSNAPPFEPKGTKLAFKESSWKELNWEG